MKNASSEQVAAMTVLIFDRLQGYTRLREVQILAMAAAFLLACDAMGVDPKEAFSAVTNLMADPLKADGIRDQFAAMRDYLEADVLRRGQAGGIL